MLNILLLILKIIGIVIAIAIGLILFVVLVVLFVPIRYRMFAVKGSEEDAKIKASVNVSYILHLFSVWIKYDEELDIKIKILGISLKKKNSKHEDEVADNSDKLAEAEYEVDWNDEQPSQQLCDHNTIPNESVNNEAKKIDDNSKELDEDIIESVHENESESVLGNSVSERFGSFVEFISKLLQKIYDSLKSIYNGVESVTDKIESFSIKLENMISFVSDERNKNACALVLSEALVIVKKLLPQKVKGYIHFGFDDPATTGQILVILGILYSVIPKKMSILPEFEYNCLDFEVSGKGSFRPIVAIVAAWKIFFNKDCRRLWNKLKKSNNK